MKKLLVLLLLIPSLSWGESYICAFKCFIGDDICQTTYTRKNNTFIDEWNREFIFVEDKRNLAMTDMFIDESEGSAIFTAIIDKQTLKYTKSTTTIDGGRGFSDGSCTLVK